MARKRKDLEAGGVDQSEKKRRKLERQEKKRQDDAQAAIALSGLARDSLTEAATAVEPPQSPVTSKAPGTHKKEKKVKKHKADDRPTSDSRLGKLEPAVDTAKEVAPNVGKVPEHEQAVMLSKLKKGKDKIHAQESTTNGANGQSPTDSPQESAVKALTKRERKRRNKELKEQAEREQEQMRTTIPASEDHQHASRSLSPLAGVDVEALKAQIKAEIRQEDEAARKAKIEAKKERRKARKAATAAAATCQSEDGAMEVDDGEAGIIEAKQTVVGKGESSMNGNTGRYVHPLTTIRGAKPTSNSKQVAEVGNAMAALAEANRKRKSLRNQLQKLESGWSVSQRVGGSLSSIDPIYTPDGESILLTYSSYVRLYSLKTSLPIHTFEVSKGRITGIDLAAYPSELFISTDAGRLERWDWLAGNRLALFDLGTPIRALCSKFEGLDEDATKVYTIEDAKPSNSEDKGAGRLQCQVTVHQLHKNHNQNRAKTLYKTPFRANILRVLDGGRLVVASAGRQLIVGISRSHGRTESFDSLSFSWHELECLDTISCLDVRIRKGGSSTLDADIAIGGASGPIYVYRNLISQLVGIAKQKSTTQPSIQKLHWHRFTVKALRFSTDGNYLISGGLETVLCSWQLDTGRRQDLPHLTAPIEGLVISPDGASYALKLGNNSLIVLSTLDFEPTFAVSGPAWPAVTGRAAATFPAIIRPHVTPAQMLLAVPSSTSSGSDTSSGSAVYLQTTDARTGVQLEKQALTRTNVTDRVSDPYGRLLDEPKITHLAVTKDGKWLATVEHWIPPLGDFDHLAQQEDKELQSQVRQETFLKFWSRNEESKTWQLTSRIDSPHSEGVWAAGSILDISTDALGFITIGTDGSIKTWHRRGRYRNGLLVKDKTGSGLTNWECIRSFSTSPAPVVQGRSDALVTAKLAMAADDSLLVAVLKYRESAKVSLINHIEGTVLSTRTDLPMQILIGAAIVDRYLILMTENLLVWDLVENKLHFTYALRCAALPASTLLSFSHLAAHDSGTFAITIPHPAAKKGELAIFDPASPQPLTVKQLSVPTRALLPAPSSGGYHIIDASTQIRHVTPPIEVSGMADLASLDVEEHPMEQTSSVQLANLSLRDPKRADIEAQSEDEAETSVLPRTQSESVVTQTKLSKLFESYNPLAQTSMLSMFEKVAGLALGRQDSAIE